MCIKQASFPDGLAYVCTLPYTHGLGFWRSTERLDSVRTLTEGTGAAA